MMLTPGILILSLCCSLSATPDTSLKETASPLRQPVSLIFDTDMGNDIDDALALGVIHALQSRGECRLLAVTVSKDNTYSAPFIDLVNGTLCSL